MAGGVTPVEGAVLRQTAFSVEQMAPGGIERPRPGQIDADDLQRALARLDELLARPNDASRRASLREVKERTEQLRLRFVEGGRLPLVYVDGSVWGLEARLRSAAIEIDFSFGDRDGSVSVGDLRQARHRYGQVRGPVGWNRLLLTDEVERKLYPDRTLSSTSGMKLLPDDWLTGSDKPLERLRKVSRYLDDAALARTYADIAARFACAPDGDPHAADYEQALGLLGAEIRQRGSIRPTITDIARIGCEDPGVKTSLRTPIEMSRKLSPILLIERFIG